MVASYHQDPFAVDGGAGSSGASSGGGGKKGTGKKRLQSPLRVPHEPEGPPLAKLRLSEEPL